MLRNSSTMKLLLSLSFVAFASSASVERSPSFTLVGDRSDNGAPIIAVTFPNGHSDTLHLSHFDADVRDCRFNGHLLSDPEACLAVTGCPGQEDVELTIFSEHAPGSRMYKWNKDGSVENLDSPVTVSINELLCLKNAFVLKQQVILFEIDCAIFYTNLHELFCQFIS